MRLSRKHSRQYELRHLMKKKCRNNDVVVFNEKPRKRPTRARVIFAEDVAPFLPLHNQKSKKGANTSSLPKSNKPTHTNAIDNPKYSDGNYTEIAFNMFQALHDDPLSSRSPLPKSLQKTSSPTITPLARTNAPLNLLQQMQWALGCITQLGYTLHDGIVVPPP